jgi:hypothetical protein
VPVPAEATIALGEVIGSAQEGLLALAVGTGLQVKQVLMGESVTAVCGPRDKHNGDWVGYRHGAEAGSVTLGGRRVPVERPRVRSVGRALDPALPGRPGAGRRAGRGRRQRDEQVGGVPAGSSSPPRRPWPSCWPPRSTAWT